MFDLKEQVQYKMNSKYWSRGTWVYSSWSIGNIFVNQDLNSIVFWVYVESSDLSKDTM